MAKSSPADVIDSYRRRQKRRLPFTFGDVSQGLLFVFIIASTLYIALTGGPKLPTLVDLKTNTPTFTPSITPTASQTATITPTPTDTPDPRYQCDCSSPVVIIITATFAPTDTALPLPSATSTATLVPTITASPRATFTPSDTPTPTATFTPTPTPIMHTVGRGDTLSGIALRYGVSVEAIQALNNLNGTIITVGQVLQIPPAP